MIVLEDTDYTVVKEYTLFLKDELVKTFLDENELRSICKRTNCQIELTNRILNRKVGGFKIVKYAIVQVKGKDDHSIRQCNRLLEQRCPHYRKRQEYNRKPYSCTLFSEESTPDNASLYFQYQRSGATTYQFGNVLLKSPFESNWKRPLDECYWKSNDSDLKKGIMIPSSKQAENYFSYHLRNSYFSQESYKNKPYSSYFFTKTPGIEQNNQEKTKPTKVGDYSKCKDVFLYNEMSQEPATCVDKQNIKKSDNLKSKTNETQTSEHSNKEKMNDRLTIKGDRVAGSHNDPGAKPKENQIDIDTGINITNEKLLRSNPPESSNGLKYFLHEFSATPLNIVSKPSEINSSSYIISATEDEHNSFHQEINKSLVDVIIIEDENLMYNTASIQMKECSKTNVEQNSIQDLIYSKDDKNTGSIEIQYDTDMIDVTLPEVETYLNSKKEYIPNEKSEMTDSLKEIKEDVNTDLKENISYNEMRPSTIEINFGTETKISEDEIKKLNVQDFSVSSKYEQINFQIISGNTEPNTSLIQDQTNPSFSSETIDKATFRSQNSTGTQIVISPNKLEPNENGNSELEVLITENQMNLHDNMVKNIKHESNRDELMNRMSEENKSLILIKTPMITKEIVMVDDFCSLDPTLHEIDDKMASEIYKISKEFLGSSRVSSSKESNKWKFIEKLTPEMKEFQESDNFFLFKSKSSTSLDKIIKTTLSSYETNINPFAEDRILVKEDSILLLSHLPISIHKGKSSEILESISDTKTELGTNNEEIDLVSKDKNSQQNLRETQPVGQSLSVKINSDMDEMKKVKSNNEIMDQPKFLSITSAKTYDPNSGLFYDQTEVNIATSYPILNTVLNDNETSALHLEMKVKDNYQKFLNELSISKNESEIESPILEMPCESVDYKSDGCESQRNAEKDDSYSIPSEVPTVIKILKSPAEILRATLETSERSEKKLLNCCSITNYRCRTSKDKTDKDSKVKKYSNDGKEQKENLKLSKNHESSIVTSQPVEHQLKGRKSNTAKARSGKSIKKSKKPYARNQIDETQNNDFSLESVATNDEVICELLESQIVNDISNNSLETRSNSTKNWRKENQNNPKVETLTKFENLSGMDILVQQLANKLMIDISHLTNENMNYPEVMEIDSESQSSITMFSINFEIPIKSSESIVNVGNSNAFNHQMLLNSLSSKISSFTAIPPDSKYDTIPYSFNETSSLSSHNLVNASSSTDFFPESVRKGFDDFGAPTNLTHINSSPFVDVEISKGSSDLQFSKWNYHFPIWETLDFLKSISSLKHSIAEQDYTIDRIYQSEILIRAVETVAIQISLPKYCWKNVSSSNKSYQHSNRPFVDKFYVLHLKPNIKVTTEYCFATFFSTVPHIVNINHQDSKLLVIYYNRNVKLNTSKSKSTSKIIYNYSSEEMSKIPRTKKKRIDMNPSMKNGNHSEFCASHIIKARSIMEEREQQQLTSCRHKPLIDVHSKKMMSHANSQRESNIKEWIVRNNHYSKE